MKTIVLEQPNVLSRPDLQKVLRESRKQGIVLCRHCGEHQATDVHHIDGNHGYNAPGNLVAYCKRCHNEIHDISDNLTELTVVVRQLDSIKQQRISMGNRISAYRKLGFDVPVAQAIFDNLKDMEAATKEFVAAMIGQEAIYQAYLSRVSGLGPSLSADLVTSIASIDRFWTISSLWAYSGLDVRDGSAPKRKRGEKANWNQKIRMTLLGDHKVVDQFVLHRNTYGRTLYDQYKAFYVERDGGTLTKAHVDNRARRKLAKVFLSCLWVAWSQLDGLEVTKPYCEDKLRNHSHIITPEDWAGEGWLSDYLNSVEV